jgi:hypothetical protein
MALGVAIRSVETDQPYLGAVSVDVSVVGGQGQVRLFFHVDGDLIGSWDGRSGVFTFEPSPDVRPRRILTARAVDRRGAWGAASTLFAAVPPPVRKEAPAAFTTA